VAGVNTLARRLANRRVLICAGAGGVGKTTVSAAVAVGLAARGRRVAVVTIDPARRLAEALGLDQLGNEPRLVDPRRFEEAGVEMRGELWAMMLDARRTFDELIAQLAPNAATRDEILANPVYRHLSSAVAGSQEYTAIAKLFELDRTGEYEAIVLDTPPSRNALDFLDAPARLSAFLEGRAFSLFMRPTAGATRAASVVLAAVGRVVGVGMLDDLAGFFRLLSALSGGLRARAAGVEALLSDRAVAFLVISSPDRRAVEEAVFFAGQLAAAGMHRCGVIVNRVHPRESARVDVDEITARLTPALGARLAATVARTHAEMQLLARRDAAAVDRLRRALREPDPVCLAERELEVRSIEGLLELCDELFDRQPRRVG
jgi:anion-transporting  ArsA/GET3 family ATPase